MAKDAMGFQIKRAKEPIADRDDCFEEAHWVPTNNAGTPPLNPKVHWLNMNKAQGSKEADMKAMILILLLWNDRFGQGFSFLLVNCISNSQQLLCQVFSDVVVEPSPVVSAFNFHLQHSFWVIWSSSLRSVCPCHLSLFSNILGISLTSICFLATFFFNPVHLGYSKCPVYNMQHPQLRNTQPPFPFLLDSQGLYIIAGLIVVIPVVKISPFCWAVIFYRIIHQYARCPLFDSPYCTSGQYIFADITTVLKILPFPFADTSALDSLL